MEIISITDDDKMEDLLLAFLGNFPTPLVRVIVDYCQPLTTFDTSIPCLWLKSSIRCRVAGDDKVTYINGDGNIYQATMTDTEEKILVSRNQISLALQAAGLMQSKNKFGIGAITQLSDRLIMGVDIRNKEGIRYMLVTLRGEGEKLVINNFIYSLGKEFTNLENTGNTISVRQIANHLDRIMTLTPDLGIIADFTCERNYRAWFVADAYAKYQICKHYPPIQWLDIHGRQITLRATINKYTRSQYPLGRIGKLGTGVYATFVTNWLDRILITDGDEKHREINYGKGCDWRISEHHIVGDTLLFITTDKDGIASQGYQMWLA